jgi:hypothetical protein
MIEELTLPSGKKRSMFEARIPGQSLTEPEGKYPWDKPPKYNNIDDVMEMYLSTIGDQEAMFNLFTALEAGIPVAQIVQTMTLQGIGEGLYTPDIALLVMPELVMLIIGIAKAAEIEFKHGYEREAEKNMMALAKAKEEVTAEQVEAGIAVVTEKQQETGGLMSKPEMES